MRQTLSSAVARRAVLQLTVVFSVASIILYALFSATLLDELPDITSARRANFNAMRSTTGQQRWWHSAVDNETALTPADVNYADRYSHYSARLSRSSRHAKDALGEMKFLRGQSVDAFDGRVPQDAIGGRGLTSLPAAMSDNQRLPTPHLTDRPLQHGTRRLRDSAWQAATTTDSELSSTTVSRAHQRVSDDDDEMETVGEKELDIASIRVTSSHCRLPDGDHCHVITGPPPLNSVPHVLHQTSDEVTVSTQVADWMRSWRVHNPSFETWFWTDSAVRCLLDSYFPSWLVKLYDTYPLAIHRADLRKYVVLYAVGGIVADLDVECLQPLRPLLDWLQSSRHACVLGQEPQLHREFLYRHSSTTEIYVTTAIMACRPQHPFVRFVLSLLPKYADNADKLSWNDNVLNSTGPTFLSEALRLYNARRSMHHKSDDLLVAPSGWFTPTYDPVHTAHFQTLCLLRATRSSKRAAGCDQLLHNKADNNSYTTHHWIHSWSDSFVNGPLVNVTQLTRVTRLIT